MLSKFSYQSNGYNIEEVNQFINDVIKESQGIIKKCQDQQEKIKKLEIELDHYKKNEDILKDAINNVEKRKQLAKDEAEIVLEDARVNANRIINDALLRADEINLKRDLLEKNIKIFKRKLKVIMEQQKSVVDEIDNLEFSDD